MLRYNFNRVFKARGIERPFTFLKQSGFSDTFASRAKNGRVSRLDLRLIERLCISLRCTPNDFIEWEPGPEQDLDEAHPLHKIRKNDRVIDIARTLNSVPIDKLDEIDQLIRERIKED